MAQSKYDKSLSACFSGHRIVPYFHLKRLERQLRTAIISAYSEGCHNFFCGMAMGYDLLAAETVLSLQSELPDLRLIAVIPYRGQTERWSDTMKSRYDDILRNTNDTVILSEHYYQGCLLRRNDYMVVHYSLNIFSEISFYRFSLYITYLQIFSFGLNTHEISRF